EGHFLALLYKIQDDFMGESTDYSYKNNTVNESIYQHDKKKKHNRSNNVGYDIKSSHSKSKSINSYGLIGKLSKEERSIWEAFAAGISRKFDISRIESHEGMLYYGVDGLPDVRGLKFIRSGLFLGECKKKRFEPSQTLAMALRSDEYENVINLPHNDGNIVRYLKGETLSIQSMELIKPDTFSFGQSKGTDERAGGSDSPVDVHDGTVLVCVDGYPLGWGKKTGDIIKNKYHPGWRLM
ncbi:MAG: RsmF rRNA methyltransferase first C-terminal domain-containing protein, partial [Eubacterium sp.]|nr:RsmF rRNA methyltransferase first C-terminal domain-containing protein [Eubacterium sp.]